jgi:hypothetical protein
METLISSVNIQTILVLATIAIVFLLVKLLLRILQTSFGLILAILAIVLVLQYGFGISPSQLWAEVGSLPQDIVQVVSSFDLNTITSVFPG